MDTNDASGRAGLEALRRAAACWTAGDLDGYLGLYADDVVLHGYPGVGPGLPAVRGFYQAFTAAFPGSRLVLQDTFASGDRVACRFVVRGRHDGPFLGVDATGRAVEIPGITILRFRGERCVERWSQADFAGLMAQLSGPTPV